MQFQIKTELAIEAAKSSLVKHTQEYQDACDIWVLDVKLLLVNIKNDLDKDTVKVDTESLVNLLHTRPIDNSPEYKKFIGAMETALTSGQSIITMTEFDYDQIFNDNWSWRIQSRFTNMIYSTKKVK